MAALLLGRGGDLPVLISWVCPSPLPATRPDYVGVPSGGSYPALLGGTGGPLSPAYAPDAASTFTRP